MTSITLAGNALVISTPYHPGFVQDLKAAVPATERTFDKARKAWVVDPRHGGNAQRLILRYFGEMLTVPQVASPAKTETRVLEVRYIGTCKDRGGESSAFGWCDGGWNVILSEACIKDWFGQPRDPSAESTLYNALGVDRAAPQYTLKAAYRRLSRQWHPDVSKEPNSHEQFIAIRHAYEILSATDKRARYDVGLALSARAGTTTQYQRGQDYRSPLRCGILIAEGVERVGRFNVVKILDWMDITNARGQVLVTSWAMGADKFSESWV